MIVLAVAMGCLFVPLTVDRGGQRRQHRRRSGVRAAQRRPAGRRRARPVGDDHRVRHVGEELGQRPLPTSLLAQVPHKSLAQCGRRLPAGPRAEPACSRTTSRSSSRRTRTRRWPSSSSGPFADFARELQAYASGKGFLTGAAFGVVAIIAAVVLINVKKTDLPAETEAEAVPVGRGLTDPRVVDISAAQRWPSRSHSARIRPLATSGRDRTSALDHVDGQAAARSLLVLDLHVARRSRASS